MPKTVWRRVSFRDEDGERVVYQPGDTLERKHEEFVTNPAVFEPPDLPGLENMNPVLLRAAADANSMKLGDSDEEDAWGGITVPQMKQMAEEHVPPVDLTGLSRKAEIVTALEEAGITPDDFED